ncbi:hypothetical protein [Helicobacter bilis]|uniref:hypothetical protein n=1 Tax=Helicobacter bilis TaxID=37372 RepID=UPI00248D63B7|nr:hypothetical protein [Helicobacter bilis]
MFAVYNLVIFSFAESLFTYSFFIALPLLSLSIPHSIALAFIQFSLCTTSSCVFLIFDFILPKVAFPCNFRISR